MSATLSSPAATPQAAAGPIPWTCPFCPLLCDGFALERRGEGYGLVGSDCPRAAAGLARFSAAPVQATPLIDGVPATLDAALDAAAALLAASRQPLFGGLGTEVEGARALYPLACATGAISDNAGGAALLHGLRALQDRGHFTTTLAEVRNRADVIVCVGGTPRENFPEIWRRCGIGRDDERLVAERDVIFLGADKDPVLEGRPGVTQHAVPLEGDLFDMLAALAALVAERKLPAASPTLVGLAERLRQAKYAVLIWEAPRLPAHGSLLVEALNQTVAVLNRHTRAATLPLGGADGAASVNQTFTWLSGVPLRSRAGPLGLEHEPLRYDTAALLASRSVDALLWVASYGTEPPRPDAAVPTVVLGGPGVAVPVRGVFIPVATPAIGDGGHMFRTDGVVALPLERVRDDGLPGVARVARALTERVRALKNGGQA